MMKKYLRVIGEVLGDIFVAIVLFIENNLRNFASILNIICPYLMWYIGAYLYHERGVLAVGGEIFIPLLFFMIIAFIRQLANKIGKGTTIPVPHERFTNEMEDGEVNIPIERMEELIIYMADLEDWMERKGLLK